MQAIQDTLELGMAHGPAFSASSGWPLRVLIVCESSGTVRQAFRALGHDAWSCDMLPADDESPHHYQCDALSVLDKGWDMMIAHPPCTYLSSSGMHWTTRGLRDPQLTEDALTFVRQLMDAPIDRIAIENPVGAISTRIRPATQYVNPYDFGDDASKKTGLWLKNLPPLQPTEYVEPRLVDGKKRWANQCDSGQNKLAPSADRWKQRSKTYEGIANAMAEQWGGRTKWRRVSFAMDCVGYDEESGEMGSECAVCGGDYVECECPGPTQDELYEYQERNGILYACERQANESGVAAPPTKLAANQTNEKR